ncbi:uncharacterized protein MELLADRAFT_110859 [Melampsora larici-populina 98AG31]|uniref:Alpha-type protein kinase domain-containing protein n=1 Tax=Melampsora larici-populina (strain 98AG31 / pathotype 3-4-7) TaxID=747676 RepID=F4S182_MELLP|nr:uncharacterized protein MELLADRAFT_110859 [Melampsora larici-populina 98AG31]EGG01608.1 hypothetical protein MELLADRAFT_110859 [Melampsora larici-populina 98AG31]
MSTPGKSPTAEPGPCSKEDIDKRLQNLEVDDQTLCSDKIEGHKDEEEEEHQDNDDQSDDDRVLYYAAIDDISARETGCIYRLFAKSINQSHPPYNPYEWLNFMEDSVRFQVKQPVQLPARDTAFWVAKNIYIDAHDELHGKYIIKSSLLWDDCDSRAHCFERSQSNRYATTLLEAFRQSILIHKRRKERKRGASNNLHRQIYSDCCALKTARSVYDGAPRWLICEGLYDPNTTHRYIWEYDFNSLPRDKQTWTDHINAWVHYTYEVSGNQTLIVGLDCDEHGVLTNLVLFTKGKPLHYDESAVMKGRIEHTFMHFRKQHECNKICEHVGLSKLQNSKGKAKDVMELMYLNSP